MFVPYSLDGENGFIKKFYFFASSYFDVLYNMFINESLYYFFIIFFNLYENYNFTKLQRTF
jgi:hypothetical protein